MRFTSKSLVSIDFNPWKIHNSRVNIAQCNQLSRYLMTRKSKWPSMSRIKAKSESNPRVHRILWWSWCSTYCSANWQYRVWYISICNRGAKFLAVPDTSYGNLRVRLQSSSVRIVESIEELQWLAVLVDYDENGYLLQLFTIPVQDRPVLFLEIIQRRNHQGFGDGNFKALFEVVERKQSVRIICSNLLSITLFSNCTQCYCDNKLLIHTRQVQCSYFDAYLLIVFWYWRRKLTNCYYCNG
jgi:hypothetical protein